MDRKDFDRLLAQGVIPSVLLFEGDEEHMKQAALEALQKKTLPERQRFTKDTDSVRRLPHPGAAASGAERTLYARFSAPVRIVAA